MRRLFLNRHGEPRVKFRLARLILAATWVAVVSSLHEYPWLAAGVGAILIIGYLHRLSLGRTSPAAAFAFVAVAVIASLVAGLPYVLAELQGKKSIRLVTEQDVHDFFVTIVCLSLVLSALVAAIVAIDNRHEWFNHLR